MTIRYDIGSTGHYGDHISYLPDRDSRPILMERSIPHMATSALLTPAEALDPKWADIFRDAGAEWFIPLLRRMAAGDQVSLGEIEADYLAARGESLAKIEDPRNFNSDELHRVT